MYIPNEDQFNPEDLTTKNVQLWQNGLMMTVIPLEDAKQLVRERIYFVITCQAINYNESLKEEK